jgi:WG repeat protein
LEFFCVPRFALLEEETMFEGLRNKRLTMSAFVFATIIVTQCSARAQPGTAIAPGSFTVLLAVKSANGKWGYQDQGGALVIPAQFDKATEFSEGLAAVALHKKIGYIDTNGKMVIAPHFVHGEPFHEGLALVYTTWGLNILGRTEGWDLFRRAGYLDHTGKTVIGPRLAENANSFSEGVAAFQPGVASPGRAKWGYLDKTGKWAIKPTFEIASDFSEGLAAVQVSVGKEPHKKQPTYKWGYVDHDGNFVIPPQFFSAMPFRHGVAVISQWDMQGHLHPRRCIDKQANLLRVCPARRPEKIPGSTILR